MKRPSVVKGEGALNVVITIGFWILVIWGASSLFTNDSSTSDSYGDSSSGNYYYDDEREAEYYEEPENPYSSGTGHSAGYEWAEENDVDSCDGNSQSFIEGCEEYVNQRDEVESYEDESNYYDEYRY